jgi:glycosyltransferase involved in cell wall biosynthesis
VSGISWSFTAHRWDIAENSLIPLKARTAKFVRAISERGAAELASLVRPADRAKISVLHLGIEMPPRRRATVPAPGRPVRLLEAANLKLGKGHADLIQAVSLLRDRGIAVQLDLAGEGPLQQDFEALSVKLGVAEQVCFLGCVPHDELLRDLSAGRWDLFVLPSLMEGIPVSVMEAMAAGVPVVVTPVGGVPELVRPGAGVVVPPGDARALADGLAEIVTSPSRWPDMVEAGRDAVEASFAVERIVPELVRWMSVGERPAAPQALRASPCSKPWHWRGRSTGARFAERAEGDVRDLGAAR